MKEKQPVEALHLIDEMPRNSMFDYLLRPESAQKSFQKFSRDLKDSFTEKKNYIESSSCDFEFSIGMCEKALKINWNFDKVLIH